MNIFKKNRPQKLTDNELIANYKSNGDGIYLGELYKRYSHLVYGVCLKYLKNEEEGEDAVIQIFEKLMEDLKKHEIANFKSWLHSVARNHCLMFLRKKQVVIKKVNEYEAVYEHEETFAAPFEVNEKMEQELVFTDLEKAIAVLKEEQRVCIELFFLKEKCYQEVAEETGFSEKQVKSYIQNGKRNLAIQMNNLKI